MVFGPNMQNFADVTRSFVAQKRGGPGARRGSSWKKRSPDLLADENRRAETGAERAESRRVKISARLTARWK